jgi:transcriptional antiterminator NusG
MKKRWYVVHTLSGHEQRVKKSLEKAIAAKGLEERIGKVLVPTEQVVEMKKGKRSVTTRKFLPSYVLVEMVLDKETGHLVVNTPGITNFVGATGKPQPLQEAEVERILEQVSHRQGEKLEIPFKVGDAIKVTDGPFTDFSGVVSEVNQERGKVKVMVSIFGRSTPVELDFLQVQRI